MPRMGLSALGAEETVGSSPQCLCWGGPAAPRHWGIDSPQQPWRGYLPLSVQSLRQGRTIPEASVFLPESV